MMSAKKIALIVALLIVALPRLCLAERLGFQIGASSEHIDLEASYESPLNDSYQEMGAGLYYHDDYWITNLNFSLKGEVFTSGLTLGLGLKGFFGEIENRNKDFDLRAVGFRILGAYDFKEMFYDLPMNASVSICYAPDPLSFSDTNRYQEFRLSIFLYILRNAAIGISYTDFEARFDDPSGEVKESDDAVLVSLRLGF
ncbi:MAG: hypothetical protein JSW13_03555 [Candidatus Aerophobus sp.]|nr:MAG: hypothetical protein JSW13_03555 [Candidatus Aerophobus sp.]